MKRSFKLPLHRTRVRSDVEEELEFHLQGRVDELIAAGHSRADAEREARQRFGDRDRVEAEVERIDLATVQRRHLGERAGALIRDTRYAVRGLVRRPLYAIAVVFTLALAIGANTTVFSVVEAVLLAPFDFPEINRIVNVNNDFPLMNLRNAGTSALESLDLFARKDLFSVAASVTGEGTTVEIHDSPTRTSGALTLGEFWTLTGAKPLYGRLYRPEDSEFGKPPVVVLSHRLWQQISGDTAILGRTITMNEKPYEVIGILPPEFNYPRGYNFWRPFVLDSAALDQANNRGTLTQRFLGRMQSGMTITRLRPTLTKLADEWHRTYTQNYQRGGHTLVVESFVDGQAGSLRPIVVALFGAVLFVLLIACANIASLQLVRATGRARELAVRAALGAGRGAIARQIIVESALLAVVGGALGIGIANGGLLLLRNANVAQFPALRELRIDATVLWFTLGAIVLSAVIFGAAPAFRAARTDVNDALRDSGRGSSGGVARHRFLRASVVVQNALVLVLIIAAALTIRSLSHLVQTDPGFNADHVVTFSIALPSKRYAGGPERLAFFRSLDERLKAIPGTQSVGFALGVPFTGSAGSTSYTLDGVPAQAGEPQRHADQAFVFGDYFRTMGIEIVKGRDFSAADFAAGLPVMIVDETLVRQSFGDRDPIGARISHGRDGTIIGVARSVKLNGLDDAPHPLVYHNYANRAGQLPALVVVMRSTLPSAEAIKAARLTLAELDPRLPVAAPRALTERLNDSVGPRRLVTNVLAGFAGLALMLALLGLYAVMSYVVNQRTREIGIRVAMGAQRGQIARLVVRDGAMLAGLGLGLGVAAFLVFGRVVQSLLYGVTMLDPVSIGAAVLLLGVVTMVACWFPARRAVRVDPVVTLRAE